MHGVFIIYSRTRFELGKNEKIIFFSHNTSPRYCENEQTVIVGSETIILTDNANYVFDSHLCFFQKNDNAQLLLKNIVCSDIKYNKTQLHPILIGAIQELKYELKEIISGPRFLCSNFDDLKQRICAKISIPTITEDCC